MELRDDTAAKAAGDLTQQGTLDAVMQRVAAAESVLQAAIAARKALRGSPMGEVSGDGGSHEGPAAPYASPLGIASDEVASGHDTAGERPGLSTTAEPQRRRMLQAVLVDREDTADEQERCARCCHSHRNDHGKLGMPTPTLAVSMLLSASGSLRAPEIMCLHKVHAYCAAAPSWRLRW